MPWCHELDIYRPLEEDVMLAWLEVSVKGGYDVGALVDVNLSLWLVSTLLVPRLETDTCNDPSHSDQDFVL